MADAFKKIYFATIRMAHFTKPLKWVAIQKCLVNPALQIADPWTFLTYPLLGGLIVAADVNMKQINYYSRKHNSLK